MVFSSTLFLVWFLPLFLVGYHLIDRRWKNHFILAASIFFYSWGGPVFIFAILGTTFLDFQLVKIMDRQPTERRRKQWLAVPILMNLGLLAYFKYANFFVENVSGLLHSLGIMHTEWVEIALPLGISFYTFESITYVVDVYRRVHPPLGRFTDYQFYILFFPKLLVGPIVRYHEFGPQIHGREESDDLRLAGLNRIFTGLAKKVLIANMISSVPVQVFSANPADISSAEAWMAMLCYTLQIYFDFSGYTDIAIGLGNLMGFRLPENFDNPYTSRSVTEFWQRWHISLGRFFMNYLYIPLGGNRKGPARTMLNLWIVFLTCGLWHGASWNLLLWGAWHGCYLVAERFFLGKWLNGLPGFLRVAYTFTAVGISLMLFWPDTMGHALDFYKVLFTGGGDGMGYQVPAEFYVALIAGLIFTFWCLVPPLKKIHDRWYAIEKPWSLHLTSIGLGLVVLIVSLSYFSWFPFNPFIYLRF